MDKLIAGSIIVTMDKDRRILEDGAIAIQDDRILEGGGTLPLMEKYRPQVSQILNAHGKVVFPGFINLHTHAGLSILRGVGDETVTFPSYTRSIPQGVMLFPEDMYIFS